MPAGPLTTALVMLLIAAAVGIAAKRLRIHYNIALVLVGVGLGTSNLLPEVALDPGLILQIFLPILLFEAAISTDLGRLRENLLPVAVLAGPGILVTVVVAGAVFHLMLGLSWTVALLLGAILSATDTIAVIASFRKVRAPAGLRNLVENESLFNDGTALVAFTTLMGVLDRGSFDLREGALGLVWVIGAGVVIGALVGYLASLALRGTEDHLMEIMLTVLATYGASVLATAARTSAVLAVVAVGITVATVGWPVVTPTGKVAIRSFWEVAAFGVNSVVFLLIGLQVELPALVGAAPAVAIGVLAITAGRLAAVYPLLLAVRAGGRRVPASWQHLLVWGNLKGGLSMALALSLPVAMPQRDLLTTVVFGAALVTLTVQGLSLVPLIRALGLGQAGEAEQRLEREQARLISARAAQAELVRLQQLGVLPMGVFQRLRASYQGAIARSERQLRDLITFSADEEPAHVQNVRRRLLTVEKSALRDAVNAGILREEVAGELSADIDRSLAALAERGERG